MLANAPIGDLAIASADILSGHLAGAVALRDSGTFTVEIIFIIYSNLIMAFSYFANYKLTYLW